MTYNTQAPKPEAFIAVNKGRRKVEGTNRVYLNNDQEFQIELFNPTTNNILAKIFINGEELNQAGLLIKPAQRIFLERYLDVAKKFKFSTYEVEANNALVDGIIKDNGSVEVRFFKAIVTAPAPVNTWTPYIWFHGNDNNPITYDTWNNCTITTSGGVGQTTTLNTGQTTNGTTTTLAKGGFSTNTVHTAYYSAPTQVTSIPATFSTAMYSAPINTTGSVTLDGLNADMLDGYHASEYAAPTKETGRVEKGETSKQKFINVIAEFEYFPFHTVNYKLLPISQKVIEGLNVKIFCTNCGRKLGPKDKFCANCGTKV